jgi:hypothetical protein
VVYYEEYYYEEYAYHGPPQIRLEDVNFALTSAAIITNGIMISRDQRSPAAAFFGYAFGASSLYLGLSGTASHPVANVLLGAASIALATWNLQVSHGGPQPGDTWQDGAYPTRTASPLAGVTLNF